jgi:putative hydrolase of the HAD superfamily
MAGPTTVFDLDDTLVADVATARESLRRAAALLPDQDPARVEEVVFGTARRLWRAGPYVGLGQELGIASWEALWATFEGGHGVVDGLKEWARRYRPEVWETALAELGVEDPELSRALADAYIEAQRGGHRLLAGAGEVVRSLRATAKVGLLTNGPPDIQRCKLETAGLDQSFDAVVISGEVGLGKPHPAVFAYVLEQLGAPASTAVMVGDNWRRDVLGALGAGMGAVWVAGGRPRPDGHPEVRVIDHVGELLDATD